MTERTRLFGYDLANGPVEVSPTAHFLMGGAVVNSDTETKVPRLFVAGEDAGGVHGANRLGGNGIADSCVFGRQAGKAMARFLAKERGVPEADPEMVERLAAHYRAPLGRQSGPVPADLRDRLREMNWIKVGIVRQADTLAEAMEETEELMAEALQAKVPASTNYNMIWGEWLNLINMLDFTRMSSKSASLREETRGAHARHDFPEQNDHTGLYNIFLHRGEDGRPITEKRPVDLKYVIPRA